MGTARILVVEDDVAVRNLAAAILSGVGYEVQLSAEPKQALEMLETECFDLLVTDVLMPGMNGHELAQHHARCCPRIRVLLMTGYDPETCSNCPYQPRCNTLRKPFTPQGVIEAVRRELNNSPR